ncbi:MAG: ABC transporter substrate-binding protein [Anaerolineae bacterium]|nr:ABC transporter substrate-binding protein [Anaerolineae bacterium]
MMKHTGKIALFVLALALIAAPAWAQEATPTPFALDEMTGVTLMLDWTPNTNHTGLYVAQANGYFEEANLSVTFVQPSGDIPVEQIVANGTAEFGISFQEWFTFSRAAEMPIVSIAAIIQHNTSGFATIAEQGVASPADLAGLNYGAFGSGVERPVLDLLMACDGADVDDLNFVDVGFVDALPLLETGRIDVAWIFYAWDGIRAEVQGIDLNVLMLQDYLDCVPDYYTPILITGEAMIEERPDAVRAFVEAASRGYMWAIAHPDEAADILLEAAPELDEELVRQSQAWLTDQYQADAPRWGEQALEVWEGFTAFLVENGVLETPVDNEAAFTNAFLPPAPEAAETD